MTILFFEIIAEMSKVGDLNITLVEEWANEFRNVSHHEMLVDAVAQYGVANLSIDRAALRKHDHVFSSIIPHEGRATSQKTSGRYVTQR